MRNFKWILRKYLNSKKVWNFKFIILQYLRKKKRKNRKIMGIENKVSK